LERNLARLGNKLPVAVQSLRGLCGTYDDLVPTLERLLANLQSSQVTFLWFGNSFANAPSDSSVAFLSKLLSGIYGRGKHSPSNTKALVAVDGCRDLNRILQAYGTQAAVHREFLFQGLHHANEVLGEDVFCQDDWDLRTRFDEASGVLNQNFLARRNIEVVADRKRVHVLEGEEINICQSGKWGQPQVKLMMEAAGIQITREWQHEEGDYGMSAHLPADIQCPSSEGVRGYWSRLTKDRYLLIRAHLGYQCRGCCYRLLPEEERCRGPQP
jgi:uncharacterized SAM-dependent methyltransferase